MADEGAAGASRGPRVSGMCSGRGAARVEAHTGERAGGRSGRARALSARRGGWGLRDFTRAPRHLSVQPSGGWCLLGAGAGWLSVQKVKTTAWTGSRKDTGHGP